MTLNREDAIAGYVFGVPATLIARTQGGRIPLNR